jgi:hypothetical protein
MRTGQMPPRVLLHGGEEFSATGVRSTGFTVTAAETRR